MQKKSKKVNSRTDTIKSISSSQHQRGKQTNAFKQSQKNRWQAEFATPTQKSGNSVTQT